MSKYVRTKSGVYKTVHTFPNGDYLINKILCDGLPDTLRKKDIVNEADKIEDLCDKIVAFDTHGDSPAVLSRFLGSFDLKNWIEDSKRQNGRYIFYGAIWTDEGLIYVAKMNAKGELELI